MKIFYFCVIDFDPIITKTSKAPQNDRQNLKFMKDTRTHTHVLKKNARKVVQRLFIK